MEPVPIADLEAALGRSLDGWDRSPPRYVSPVPDTDGAWFDVGAVVRVCEALAALPHTKGQWAGAPFVPEPWQIAWLIGPVFGWKHPDGRRIVRAVWDEVPRKNGKSSISSRIGVVLLAADREPGAEVYAAATTETQARIVFDEAAIVVRRADRLKGLVDVRGSVIRTPSGGGKFQVLSKVAEGAHGLNIHGGIIDEVHLHKNRGLIDAIETGTGARRQPLLWYITTAGDDDATTIYAEKHGRAVKIAEGEVVDPRMWVTIWCADADDDPFDPVTWAKANPNYPISPSHEYLEDRALAAQDTPTFLPTFLRLHLNIRSSITGTQWAGAAAWGTGGMVVAEKVAGRPAWGGLVAASATDMATICWTFDDPDGNGVAALWRWFLPEDALPDLDRRTGGHASVWVREGRLRLTEGNVIDIGALTDQIMADSRVFDVKELAYDPNGTIGIVQPITEARALTVVPIYATSPGSSLIDMERLVKSGEYQHGGDPIAAWQVRHMVVREAATGIWKIDRAGSSDIVFGIAAAELALRRYLVANRRQSAYADGHGVMVV